jgi:hypothetical protein
MEAQALMRVTTRTWTDDQLKELSGMIADGASAERASVRLKRSVVSVRAQALKIGLAFPSKRDARNRRRNASIVADPR